MKIEFSVLRQREVININDGKRLGRITDMVIDTSCGQIKGIILPGQKGITLFKSGESLYVPWKDIKRFGEDVILVDLCEKSCGKEGVEARAFAIEEEEDSME